MAWFPADRQRFNALGYPHNLVYCIVMSRINYGAAAIQLGAVCLDGQCVVTKAMLATKIGVNKRTVSRSLKQLGFKVDVVATDKINGGRALRITVPKILRVDMNTPVTTPVTTSGKQPLAKTGNIGTPLSPPLSPLVLEKRYDKTAIEVALATGTSPTPSLQAEITALAALYTGDKILEAVKRQMQIEGPKTSVPGWVRTVVSRVLKENVVEANRPDRKKPPELPQPVAAAVTQEGLAQFREALKNARQEEDVSE
jgi:hypothetical protein